MRNLSAVAAGLAVVAIFSSAPARAATTTVLDFEDLSGTGRLSDGYGAINWNGNFAHYDTPEAGFPTASGKTSVFTNYDKFEPGKWYAVGFDFSEDVQFNGAFFSGNRNYVSFNLFRDGELVHQSGRLILGDAALFLESGFAGLVDRVEVVGTSGAWVMDDVTYATGIASAVPEPGAWALMIVGFGLAGSAVRAQRRGDALRPA